MRFSELDGARVGVWGAGREIASFARQLERRLPAARIEAAVFDEPPSARERELLPAGARVASATEVQAALAECEVLVRSPGVSIHRPELRALAQSGVPVTTATSLWLSEHGSAGVLGVSGTKGKSTTAALAAHLARAAGVRVALAGNIGVPALDLLDSEAVELVVLELSSYQIADLELGPEVAVLLNLFREHIDWHGSEQAYRSEKLRLLGLAGVRVALVNGRDVQLVEQAGALAPLELFGVAGGWDVEAGGVTRRGELLIDAAALPLRGEHNALNLSAALAALELFDVQAPLPAALAGFEPLPHRLQEVLQADGVTWVDDSISTTPESALAALASLEGASVVLLAGGQDRGQDYAELARELARGHAAVIGIPTTGPRLLAAARAAGVPPERAREAADLPSAVRIARELAGGAPEAVVLLSPAAPSYDHFRDFEERGERFAQLARDSG